MGKPAAIRLRGVRQNNLKNIDIDLPVGRFIAVTGLSGAGKSSLVFETLHAEGQRRYVETFSPYTRQFLDLLDRPRVDRIENIPPSIAIEQTNTVRTSRSTVGTMTELCDFFKVWFSHVAELFDPDTGERIEDDTPRSIWKKCIESLRGTPVQLAFRIARPEQMSWEEMIPNLQKQGYTRSFCGGETVRLDDPAAAEKLSAHEEIFVVQDRLKPEPAQRARFLEAAEAALHFGQGEVFLFDKQGIQQGHFCQGLRSPATRRKFHPASPALFSFNSPVGACPECRGFGRIIEIDYDLAIPDRNLTLRDGAIKAWQGAVYSECQRDLERFCRRQKIPLDIPYNELTENEQNVIVYGEPGYGENGLEWPRAWYGIKGFFDYLETKTYKMHVRVFLSRYRAYRICSACDGARLQPEALFWKWHGHTLPELYQMPVDELVALLENNDSSGYQRHSADSPLHQADIAFDSIVSRLNYLVQVGVGYLTLDRSSRSLSGGEVERVNLTSCLGSSLVDTLFVLDEPSVGLHCRDINRLIAVLRRLTDQGNTVVVVEHDEAIIRAADVVIEVGPQPGEGGGEIVFQGGQHALLRSRKSLTGQYLSGERTILPPESRRPVSKKNGAWLHFQKASRHNLRDLDFSLPLRRFVCLSGVSGSGKSTLLKNVMHSGLRREQGLAAEEPARIESVDCGENIDEIVLVDQSPISRTPRSNPALYSGAWEAIRKLFANTDAAQSTGLTASAFSFNAGEGRCDHCQGLGYERVEMQFLSDAYIPCPICEGKRFKPEILSVSWNDSSIADILEMTVSDASAFFKNNPPIGFRLRALETVGLGYLRLGQPLNTLSGGESQRLKLVRYLPQLGTNGASEKHHALLLLDEPTTGLHRHDVRRLIDVLQTLVNEGNSLVVIEHHPDVLKAADWMIELGPEAGEQGGKIVAAGTPERIASIDTATAPFIKPADTAETLLAAEEPAAYGRNGAKRTAASATLEVVGAREHNLRNLSVAIPHKKMTVVTGVSGSGKSSLAFDIIFAEGQRRFMESMSPYARQFVEQLPRPNVDRVSGIPPTVAIEQRATTGGRKSTVATVTEVAQYLRLLYARIGIQHNPATGEPVASLSPAALHQRLEKILRTGSPRKASHLYLCAPLIRGRKGHHQPLATWLAKHGYELMRADGHLVETAAFEKLNRYQEHDIEAVIADFGTKAKTPVPPAERQGRLEEALRLGKGSCFLLRQNGQILSWFSTTRTDPVTGESFPELDPKHFSFNSSKGWCPACRGYGFIDYEAEIGECDPKDAFLYEKNGDTETGAETCPECHGDRLNPVSSAVRLYFNNGETRSLPELLQMNAPDLVTVLRNLDLDRRGKAIVTDILPQVEERLRFVEEVGLGYLTLDRSVQTLSGGEIQRIRLAAQLGSNLSGVLYVLDEPSIGLHARDNDRLIDALRRLRQKGNSLLVVEHDEDTMRAADRILDLGPGAGIHGGTLLAEGSLSSLLKNRSSLTGRYLRNGIPHPVGGDRPALPPFPSPRTRKPPGNWLILREPGLRNLKGDDLFLPFGRLVMTCGVSGAGKSTLIRDLLVPTIRQAIHKRSPRLSGGKNHDLPFTELINGNHFRKVIEVNQNPIGKTPRSTPATYLGIFDLIRKSFAGLPEAKVHGYDASRFSFNTKGGRCEVCRGAGRVKLEMNFMPDAYLPCDECGGRRYGSELLAVQWNGKSIADILELTFEEAADFFHFHKKLRDICLLMVDTGLGYLTLGQTSPTLSGGEAQRLKLVTELARGVPGGRDPAETVGQRHLYVLEEPTIGLHFADCEKLIRVLRRLADQGHTVIVIEHNLDLIADAEYLIEVGPEGGDAGGRILYQGDVEGLLRKHNTPTARFLKKHLERHRKHGARRRKTVPDNA